MTKLAYVEYVCKHTHLDGDTVQFKQGNVYQGRVVTSWLGRCHMELFDSNNKIVDIKYPYAALTFKKVTS